MDHVIGVQGGSGGWLWLTCSCKPGGVEVYSGRGAKSLDQLAQLADEHITAAERHP